MQLVRAHYTNCSNLSSVQQFIETEHRSQMNQYTILNNTLIIDNRPQSTQRLRTSAKADDACSYH